MVKDAAVCTMAVVDCGAIFLRGLYRLFKYGYIHRKISKYKVYGKMSSAGIFNNVLFDMNKR